MCTSRLRSWPARLALLIAALAGPGCGPSLSTSTETERDEIGAAVPVTLEVPEPRAGEPRPLTVRVWAAPEVRARTGWRERIVDEVDYASQFLAQLVGIQLEVTEIKDWDRRGDLGGARAELAATDPGAGAAWVIGVVDGPDKPTAAQVALGESALLGKHVVVRAWGDAVETEVLAARVAGVKPAARGEVLGAHRRHKQAVVLLHHLLRSLGAITETDPAWLMATAYAPSQAGLSDRNRAVVQLGADARVRSADAAGAELASAMLGSIEASAWGGWVERDHDDVVIQLRAIIDAARAGKAASDVPTEIYDQFQRAQALARGGKLAEAAAELEPLLAAYPAQASLRLLDCELALRAAPADAALPDTALQRCRRVTALAGGDARPHLLLAGALAAHQDKAGALAELAAAEPKVVASADPPRGWAALADAYAQLGALSLAERAAINTGRADHPIALTARTQRVRYGVTPGAVAPADEGELVAAVRGALELIYKDKLAEAAKAIAAARKRWPKAAGPGGALCDLELRKNRIAQAKAECERALAIYPDASWPRYLLGIIALRGVTGGAKLDPGLAHLRGAIASDPDLGQAWRALGKALARGQRDAELAQLRIDYQARFGQALE